MNATYAILPLSVASLTALVHLWRRRSIRLRTQRVRMTRGLQLALDRDCYTVQGPRRRPIDFVYHDCEGGEIAVVPSEGNRARKAGAGWGFTRRTG